MKHRHTPSPWNSVYPLAGRRVDGRLVREHIPNLSSVAASFDGAYEILPGIREIAMARFTLDEAPLSRSSEVHDLAKRIAASCEINPLIVGIDAAGPYIVEGSHRYDALKILKAKAFPAVVVVEEGVTP